jgi:hypothetical protein
MSVIIPPILTKRRYNRIGLPGRIYALREGTNMHQYFAAVGF